MHRQLIAIGVLLISLGTISLGQETELPEPVMGLEQRNEIRKIFLQMAKEREKLVQYVCTVDSELNLDPSNQSWSNLQIAKKINPKNTVLHFEYSKIEDAMLCYVRQSIDGPILALDGYTRRKIFHIKQEPIRKTGSMFATEKSQLRRLNL